MPKFVADSSVSPTGLKWAAPAGNSLPTARAVSNAGTSIPNNTTTKVLFGSEDWDTDNCFASSRFTASTAGYYQVNTQVAIDANNAGVLYVNVYKNGSNWAEMYIDTMLYPFGQNSTMVYLAVNDYIEVYCQHNIGSAKNTYANSNVFLDVTGIRS